MQKLSEGLGVAAVVAPGANTTGAKNSGWIDGALYLSLMAVISTGVLGTSATIDAKWQQATDSSGTGAVDIAAGQLTQIVKASGDNKQAMMNLDLAGSVTDTSKRFFRLVITVGTATSDVGAIIFGEPRHAPAGDFDLSSVVQTVYA